MLIGERLIPQSRFPGLQTANDDPQSKFAESHRLAMTASGLAVVQSRPADRQTANDDRQWDLPVVKR